MMKEPPKNCKRLVKRLGKLENSDIEQLCRNPSLVIAYYPVRDPYSESSIFAEVYCLVNETLLTKTYRFRLFYFLNTFLSSTKVPAYVIATYMKRLSRLSLQAEYPTLLTIIKIVKNLLVRHPVLLVLRDRVDERAREMESKSPNCTLREWLENDPFNPDETSDLQGTRAMDSCLWEMMPLRFHSHPKIAKASSYLGKLTGLGEESDLDFDGPADESDLEDSDGLGEESDLEGSENPEEESDLEDSNT